MAACRHWGCHAGTLISIKYGRTAHISLPADFTSLSIIFYYPMSKNYDGIHPGLPVPSGNSDL
jgi:hypothetical protein